MVEHGLTLPKSVTENISRDIMFIQSMPRLTFSDNAYSLINATRDLGIKGKRHGGAYYEQGITLLLEDAVKGNYKYGLAIDYDTWFAKYHIIDLYNLMERHPDVGVLFPFQTRRGHNYPMAMDYVDGHGHLTKVTKGNFIDGITPCDSGHFGLTMIRLTELSKLEKPWFESVPSDEGDWGLRHKDADVNFWIKCKQAGIKTALAEVYIGHLQLMCSFPGPRKENFRTYHMDINDVLDYAIPKWTIPKSYDKPLQVQKESYKTKNIVTDVEKYLKET